MKRLFPYLTPSNLKRLFASKSVEAGTRLGDSPKESPSSGPDEIRGSLKMDPQIVKPESYQTLADLLKEATGMPFLMVCDVNGEVIWEDSARAFDIAAVQKDILTHLREGQGNDLGEFKKLIAYPKDVKGEPRDGVVRFGVVVPLVCGGNRIGALVACHDRETMMTSSLRRSFSRAGELLVETLEAQSRREQAEAEAAARQETQSFLRRGYGDALLGMACKKIAKITGAEWVFVLSMDGANDREAGVVSAVFEGASVAPFSYDVAESPLRGMKDASVVFVGDGCQEAFPQDEKIQDEGIAGFAGIGLPGVRDKIAGALVVMSRRPLENEGVVRTVLESMAPRIAADLQAAGRLREAEQTGERWRERFDHLVNTDGLGILITRPDGSIDSANDYLNRWLQYSDADLKQLVRRDIIVAGADDEETRWREECVSGSRAGYERKVTVRRNDQQLIESRLSVTAVPGDGDGEVLFIETLVDIAREEKLDARLRQVESELQRVVSERAILTRSSPLPLARVDSSGKIIEANAAWCDLLEYELTQLKGTSVDSLGAGAGDGLVAVIREAADEGGPKEGGSLGFRKQSGQTFNAVVWCGGIPAGDTGAGPAEVFVALVDQSDCEAGEQAAREAADTMEALQRLPGQALGWLDTSGYFVRCTPSLEKVLNRDTAVLRSVALAGLFPESEQATLMEGMEQLRDGSRRSLSWSSEAVEGMENDHRLEFGLVALPGNDSGDGEQFILGCRDGSREKQARRDAEILDEQVGALVGQAPCGMLLVDGSGTILSGNSTSADWLGQPAGKLKGSRLEGWIEATRWERLLAQLSGPGGEDRFSMEAGLCPNDGDVLPVRITGRQVRRVSDAASEAWQWILFIENLGPLREKTEALATLRDELARVRTKAGALQGIRNAGLLIIGMNEVVLEANEAFQNRLGSAVAGMELSECFDLGDDEESFHQGVADCLTGKREAIELSVRLRESKGNFAEGDLTLHGVRQPDGDIAYLVGLWQDTSERNTLRRQWSAVDAPYRDLMEQSEVGLVCLDADGVISRINNAAADWCGLKPEEMTGEKFAARLLPTGGADVQSILQARQFTGEFEWAGPGGEAIPVCIDSRRFGDADSPDCWYLLLVRSLVREVTLAAETEHWKKRFESAFGRRDVAMAVCDERGQLLEVNPALVALSGLSQEQLLMRSWDDLMGDHEWTPPTSGEDPAPLEVPIRFSEDHEISGRLYFHPCGDAVSGGRKLLALLVDRSAETALIRRNRSLKSRMEAILSNPAVGVALLDDSGMVSRANEKFETYWNLEADGARGMDLESWLPEETATEWSGFWEEMRSNRRSRFQVEWTRDNEDQGAEAETGSSSQSARLTPVLLDPEKDDSFAILFLEDLSELAVTRGELARTQSDLASTQGSLDEARQEISGLHDNKSELMTQCSTLETSLVQLTTDRDGLREAKSSLEAEQERLIDERDKVQADLEAVRQEETRLNTDLEDRDSKLQELENHLAALQDEKARLEESLAAKEKDLAGKEEQLAAREKELAALQSERDSLDQTRLDNEKAIEERGQEKEELAAEVARVHDRLEETEHQRDSLLSDTVNSSPAALAILDETGSVREINRAFAEFLEGSRDELIEKKVEALFQDRLEDMEKLAIQNVLDGRASTFDLEIGVVTGDQVYRWLRVMGSRAPDHAAGGSQILLVAEDTTPIYEMENEKVASEGRFLATAEIASVGLLLTDGNGQIFFANPASSRLLADDGDELTGQTVNDTAHPDDPREDLKLDERMVGGEIDDYVVEKWLKNGDAPSRWLRMSVRAVRMDGGDFWYAVRILEDLTELRRTSEKLDQTEAKWNRIFEATGAAIALMGRRGEIVQQNPEVTRILGSRSEAEVGKVLARMKGSGGESFSLQFGKLVSGDVSQFEIEDEVAGADKQHIRIRVRVTPVVKPNGSFESAVAVIEPVVAQSATKASPTPDREAPAEPPAPKLEAEPPASVKPPGKPAGTGDSPEAIRKQALKESVKISESQKINVEALKQIQAPARNRPRLKGKAAPAPAPAAGKMGWLLADSSGTVLLVSPQARELLKISLEQALRKPLPEVMHVKNQNLWPHPQKETDPDIANLALMESEIWNPDNEVCKVVNASRSLVGTQGEFLGTIIILSPVLPTSDDPDTQFRETARSFLETAGKVQSWGEKDLADLLLNADIMSSDEFRKEAGRLEAEIG